MEVSHKNDVDLMTSHKTSLESQLQDERTTVASLQEEISKVFFSFLLFFFFFFNKTK